MADEVGEEGPGRGPALRDAVLEFVDVRATAAELEASEVLMALQDAYAVALLEVANGQGKTPAQRQRIYRRASAFLLASCLDLDQGTTERTRRLLRQRRPKGDPGSAQGSPGEEGPDAR
jgi:hypothetical protein